MHDTAYRTGRLFFNSYVRAGHRILEIGSMNVNGSLRDFSPAGADYFGVDLDPGPGVNVVVNQLSRLPFGPESFDVIVSSSVLEHDGMFWVTFLEICRVLKTGGYIYINAPSKGEYHRFPIDAWRFFPDAGIALRDWARVSGLEITLVESFVSRNIAGNWGDCVMIFGKLAYPAEAPVSAQLAADAMNIRVWPDLETVERYVEEWRG